MKSHGTGSRPWNFKSIGKDVVLEEGVLVFHPENIVIEDDVYVGHQSILKAYYKNEMFIGEGTWIGQQCFFHSAGEIHIGKSVGIGPGVRIITSQHDIRKDTHLPIRHRPLKFERVVIGDGCDIGIGTSILPGVELAERVQVASGAVVTKSFPKNAIIAGVPAKQIGVIE